MKEFKLIRNQDRYVAHVYTQETQPEHNFAFGLEEDFHWEERELSADEFIQFQAGQIQGLIRGRIEFGMDLMVRFSAENIMLGITVEQAQILLQKIAPLQSLLSVGAIETAVSALEYVDPDEILTVERIIKYSNEMRAFVGMPESEYAPMSLMSRAGGGLRDTAMTAARVAWPAAAGAVGAALYKFLVHT